jgi:hypothetical protein
MLWHGRCDFAAKMAATLHPVGDMGAGRRPLLPAGTASEVDWYLGLQPGDFAQYLAYWSRFARFLARDLGCQVGALVLAVTAGVDDFRMPSRTVVAELTCEAHVAVASILVDVFAGCRSAMADFVADNRRVALTGARESDPWGADDGRPYHGRSYDTIFFGSTST